MKKIKLILLAIFSVSLISCGGHVSESNVSEHGIQIRSLGSGVDVDGHSYQTYAYVVVPSTSTATINSSISFADSRTNGSEYLTCTVDNELNEFIVTCLQAFDSQATVHLLASLGSAHAEVTVDYRQKFESVAWTNNFIVDGSLSAYSWSSFAGENVSAVGGEIFTISQSFTYGGLNSHTGGFISFPDCIKTPENDDLHDLQAAFQNVIFNWLSYNLFGSNAEQGQDDLYTYLKTALASLTTSEKEDLATGIIDNSYIRLQFSFNELVHRINCSVDGLNIYSTTGTTATFLLPASVYQTYGISVPLTAITPETGAVVF